MNVFHIFKIWIAAWKIQVSVLHMEIIKLAMKIAQGGLLGTLDTVDDELNKPKIQWWKTSRMEQDEDKFLKMTIASVKYGKVSMYLLLYE